MVGMASFHCIDFVRSSQQKQISTRRVDSFGTSERSEETGGPVSSVTGQLAKFAKTEDRPELLNLVVVTRVDVKDFRRCNYTAAAVPVRF